MKQGVARQATTTMTKQEHSRQKRILRENESLKKASHGMIDLSPTNPIAQPGAGLCCVCTRTN